MVTLDNDAWVEENFGNCELGDKRRTRRLQIVAKNMLASPEESLPGQNTQWSDLKAAYRMFDSKGATFPAVCETHWKRTRQTKPGRFLLISDTTEIDRSSHHATTGQGMLGGVYGRGVHLHSCLVYNSSDKLIEGAAGSLLHYRAAVSKKETVKQRLRRIRESSIWGDLVRKIGSPPEGSQWIHVFDRGGDNFESMCHVQLNQCDWVIRASQLNRNVIAPEGNKLPLSKAIDPAELLGSYKLSLRSRPGVAARTANIEVSAMQVTLPKPQQHSPWVKQCGISEITANVVIVEETHPPKGTKAIRWVLLTSLSVTNFDEAWQVIEDYENRWLIEEYHKVIKSGCNIEGPALRTAERLEPLLGLISIIGIRLFQMKLVGRSQPKTKAQGRVPSSWLRCLKILRPKTKITEITVYGFFRQIAMLGGFLGRTGDGEPGWQTIWRGFKKMHNQLDALRIAGVI